MVVATDRLNWLDMEHRRQTYIAEGNLKRVIQLEATAFLIFLFGNLGMRFVGFLSFIKKARHILDNNFNLFFVSIILASFLIPIFFLQKGVAWNSIQFMQYFLLFFGFLGAISITEIIGLTRFKSLKILIGSLIFILAVPTQIGLLQLFYTNRPLAKVSFEEINALKFLRSQSSETATILTFPFDKYGGEKYYPPKPIYSWYDTGYVAAFSGRRTYLSDQEQLTIMGYSVDKKFEERNKIFQEESSQEVNKFLKSRKIDFVYLVYGQKFKAPLKELDLTQSYKSDNVIIYKVKTTE